MAFCDVKNYSTVVKQISQYFDRSYVIWMQYNTLVMKFENNTLMIWLACI